MSRRSDRPAPDPALFDVPMPRFRPGRAERGLETGLREARRTGELGPSDLPLIAVCRIAARALDHAEREQTVYALPQLMREYREALTVLGLVSGREGSADAIAAFVAGLGAPAVPDRP